MNFEEIDLDWFWMTERGQILHFASGGSGVVPELVRRNLEVQEAIFEGVVALRARCSSVIVEQNLPVFQNEADRSRYLSSFVEMGSAGVYSFDVCDEPNFDAQYKLIVCPSKPIALEGLGGVGAEFFANCAADLLPVSDDDLLKLEKLSL